MAFNMILHTGLLYVIVLIGFINSFPIDIIYTGEGCHCEKRLPYEVKIPVPVPPKLPVERQYDYRIEIPQISKKSKYEYSLDFEVEKPIPELPPAPLPEKHYYARVDRIALSTPDCPRDVEKPCSLGLYAANYDADKFYGYKDDCSGGPKYRIGVHYPRYLFNYFEIDSLSTPNDRTKREITKKRRQKKVLSEQLMYKKFPFEHKKSITKRAIKDEIVPNENLLNNEDQSKNLDLRNFDQSKNHDLQRPEILQFMPEVSLPNFRRGECFACQQKSKSPEVKPNKSYVHQFFCQPTVTPISVDIPKVQYYQAPNLPNSFQPKTYSNDQFQKERYVYDRLGHKYKENKGSLKLVHPTPTKTQEKQNSPIVGEPNSQYRDPEMEHLLKRIVSHHQDFIEASDHGEGILTPSVESQRQDIEFFLKRLIKDKFVKWMENRRGGGTHVYEDSSSSENDSFERVQRSLEEDFDIMPVSNKNDEGKFLYKLIPKQKLTKNKKYESSELQKIKNNHIVKFRKDGKILQLLTSPETKKYEEKNKSTEQTSTKV